MFPKLFSKIGSAVKGAIQQVIPGGPSYADVQREEEEKRRRAEQQRQQQLQQQKAQQARTQQQVQQKQPDRIQIAKPKAQPNITVVPASPRLQLKADQQKVDVNAPLKVVNNGPASPAPKPVDRRSNLAKIKDAILPGDDKSFKVSENQPKIPLQERIQIKQDEYNKGRDELRTTIKETRGDWTKQNAMLNDDKIPLKDIQKAKDEVKRVKDRQQIADQLFSPEYADAPLTRVGGKSAKQHLAEFDQMDPTAQRAFLKSLEANVRNYSDDKGQKDLAETRDQSYLLLQALEDRGQRKKNFGTFISDSADVVGGFGKGIVEPFNVVGRSLQSLTTNATAPDSDAAIYGNAQADINAKLKNGEIDMAEWVRRSNAITGTIDAQTGGMDDRGMADRLLRAAGTSIDVTSTVVPFLSGVKGFRAGTAGKEALEQAGKAGFGKVFGREVGINTALGAGGALREGTDITPESVITEAVSGGLLGGAFVGGGAALGTAKRLWGERYAPRVDELLGEGMRLEQELAQASIDQAPLIQRELDRIDDAIATTKQSFIDDVQATTAQTPQEVQIPNEMPLLEQVPTTRSAQELQVAQSDIAQRIVAATEAGDNVALEALKRELDDIGAEVDLSIAARTQTPPPADNITRAKSDIEELMAAREQAPDTVTPEERAAGVKDKAYYDNQIAETQRYVYERAAAQSQAAPGAVADEVAANDPIRQQAEEMAARATEVDRTFQPAMHNLAEEMGLKWKSGPTKSADRIAEKTIKENGGDFSQIRDSVRGTMEVADTSNIDAIVERLGKDYEVDRVKNFTSPTGYKDVKVNLRMPDGTITEVILVTPEMQAAKKTGGGHALYKEARVEENAAKLAELESEMRRLYSEADAAASRRLAASSGDISEPSTIALAGGNGSPVEATNPLTVLPSDSNRITVSDTSKNLSPGDNGSIPVSMTDQNGNVKIAEPTNVPLKERGFISSVKDSPNTLPEVKKGLGDVDPYSPVTNKDALAAADVEIAKDFEGAVERAKTNGTYSLEQQAQGMRLAEILQEQGRVGDAIEVIEKTAERATEAGQASQILAAYNRLTPEGIVMAAQREIEKAKKVNPQKYGQLAMTPEQAANLRSMAKAVQEMEPGDAKKAATRELMDEIQRVVPTPGARKFTTLWKAGLLTGVKGAVGGNTVGNAAMAVLRKISDVPAAGLDAALAQLTGQRSKTFTLKGLFSGAKEGTKVGYKNFREGVGAESVANKLDYKKTYYGRGKLGRAAQKYTDTVFNFYSASDRPFYHAALQNSLNDLAMVEAKNAGLSGKQAKLFAEGLVKEPTDDILTRAVSDAENAVFQSQNALGAALSGAKKGLSEKGGAVGEIVAETTLPFTGVPSGIAKAVLDYSPVGGARDIYRAVTAQAKGNFDQAAQRQFTEGMGKAITGTGVLWLGSQLAADGILTLGYPSDPDERALWESEGKTPYSLLVNGKWRSLNYMGPITSLLAIGGQIANSESGGFGAIAEGAASSGKAILGSTPLKGVQSVLDTVNEPDRYAERFIQNLVGSGVPTFVKDVAVSLDSKQREPGNIKEAVQSRIPLLRNDLPEKQGVFGEGLDRATSAVGSIVDPFKSSDAKTTPLTGELRRLFEAGEGAAPSQIKEKIKIDGVETELPKELQDELQKRAGTAIKAAWEKTIADPAYQALSDADKRNALQNMSSDVVAAERSRIAAENNLGQYAPDFNGKATKLSAKQEAILASGVDPANYLTGSVKVASSLSGPSKDMITKVEAMAPEAKKKFLREGQNEYNYELAKFENNDANGDLSAVDKYDKLLELGKLKITTKYSADARELYGLSETKINDFLGKNPTNKKVVEDMMALDAELAAKGFIKNRKFTDGVIGGSGGSGGGGGGGKAKKVKAPPLPKFGNFSLVAPPKIGGGPDLSDVIADYQRNVGRIRVLDTQIAPESTSNIKLSL